MDEGQQFFHVTFDDFDEQELDLGEVWDSVIFHPELEVNAEGLAPPVFPEIGSVVLFAANYQPCLGEVVEVQPHSQKPVVVNKYRPTRSSRDFLSAKFTPALADGDPEQRALTIPQIKVSGMRFDDAGYLDTPSRKRLSMTLKMWKLR